MVDLTPALEMAGAEIVYEWRTPTRVDGRRLRLSAKVDFW